MPVSEVVYVPSDCIAHHLIWTAYGWWLPNDPRGSGSKVIRNDVIGGLGEIHFGRKKIQPASRDVRRFYEQASMMLRHPLLTFDADARAEIGEAFASVIKNERYTCYACAVMPDHVHILIRKHKHFAEEMIENLKEGQSPATAGSQPTNKQSSYVDRRRRLESFSRSSGRGETHNRLCQSQPGGNRPAAPVLGIP